MLERRGGEGGGGEGGGGGGEERGEIESRWCEEGQGER